jgi:DNA-binding transcriptional MerR regulator
MGDNFVSTPQAAKIADVAERTLAWWVSTGLIKPSSESNVAPGVGNHRRFDLHDLMSICVVAELRNQGVGVRRLRRVQNELAILGDDFASARLALIGEPQGDEVADVAILRRVSDEKRLLMSLMKQPGQAMLVEPLELKPIARRVRRTFAKVAGAVPVRGRKPGRKATASGATG